MPRAGPSDSYYECGDWAAQWPERRRRQQQRLAPCAECGEDFAPGDLGPEGACEPCAESRRDAERSATVASGI